jgi:hypothetical protein
MSETRVKAVMPQAGVISAACAKNQCYSCYRRACGCVCHTSYAGRPAHIKGAATKSAASRLKPTTEHTH